MAMLFNHECYGECEFSEGAGVSEWAGANMTTTAQIKGQRNVRNCHINVR